MNFFRALFYMIKETLKLCFYLLISTSLKATHPSIIKEEFIFTDPPFASCHASTLTQTHSGAILCAWFAGSEEGAIDVAIWLSTCEQSKWDSPKKSQK